MPSQQTLPSLLRQRGWLPLCALTGLLLTGCGFTGGSGAAHSIASGSTAASANAVPLGPQLGYAWRASDKTLRPLLGVAGSAQIGPSVTSAGAYADGAVSPSGMGVLVAGDGSVYSMALPSGQPLAVNLTASPAAAIRFAPSAGTALVFSPGAQTVALLTGWPGTVTTQILNTSLAPKDAAISDAGTVALAVPSMGGVSVYIAQASGAPQLLTRVGVLGGMSFLPGSGDLLITDSKANMLLRVHSVLKNPTTTTLLQGGLLQTPGAVSATAGGAWAVVANTAADSVVRVNLAGDTPPVSIACACQPTLVAPLANGTTFRLTGLSTRPLWLADAAAATPRTLFIPGVSSHP